MDNNNGSWQSQLKEYLSTHHFTILFVIIGIVFSVLIMTIGFWRVVLLSIIVGICFFIGMLMDRGGWDLVKSFFDRILPK